MPTVIDEAKILESLRQIPEERWGEVLRILETLIDTEPPIRTGADLIRSGLVGRWADRSRGEAFRILASVVNPTAKSGGSRDFTIEKYFAVTHPATTQGIAASPCSWIRGRIAGKARLMKVDARSAGENGKAGIDA